MMLISAMILFADDRPSIKKITINNQQGYFINQQYYREILKMDKEILSLKSQITILEQNNLMLNNLNISMKKQIDSYLAQEKKSKIMNNVFIGAVSLDILSIFGCIGEGVAIYYLSQKK
jgi:hypothetical protein